MYAPKKFIYPFFVVLVSIVFIAILFLAFFSQALDVDNPSVSIVGSDAVIKMTIINNSMHSIDDIKVEITNDGITKVFPLNNDNDDSSLGAKEKYEFVASTPLSESLVYSVKVIAPFNRTIPIDFTLEQSTIDPVKAEVSLPATLYANETYTYSVKLCNISGNDLYEVLWLESAELGAFKENFFERSIPIKNSECKTVFSTLTPAKTGDLTIKFSLKVGSIEKKLSKVIQVINR